MSEALRQSPLPQEQPEAAAEQPHYYVDSAETIDTLQEKVKSMSEVAGDPLFVPNMAQVDTMKQTLAEAEGDDTISPNQKHTLALKSDLNTYKLDDEAKAGVELYVKSNNPTRLPEDLIQLRRWMIPANSKRSQKSLLKSQEKFEDYLKQRLAFNDEIAAKEAAEAQEGGQVIPMPRPTVENGGKNDEGADAEIIDIQTARPAVPGAEKIAKQNTLPPVPGATDKVNKVTDLPEVPGAAKVEDENLGRMIQEDDGEYTYKIGKQNYEDWKKAKLGLLNADAAMTEKPMGSLPPVPGAREQIDKMDKMPAVPGAEKDDARQITPDIYDAWKGLKLAELRADAKEGTRKADPSKKPEVPTNRLNEEDMPQLLDKKGEYGTFMDDELNTNWIDDENYPQSVLDALNEKPGQSRTRKWLSAAKSALKALNPVNFSQAAFARANTVGMGKEKKQLTAEEQESRKKRNKILGRVAGALAVGAGIFLVSRGWWSGNHSGAAKHVVDHIPQGGGAPHHEGAPLFTTLTLDHKGDNIWDEAAKLWTQHGVEHPTPGQIAALKNHILETNHITEAQATKMGVGAQVNVANDFFTSQASNTAGQLPIVNR